MPRAFRHPERRRNRGIIPNRGGRRERSRSENMTAIPLPLPLTLPRRAPFLPAKRGTRRGPRPLPQNRMQRSRSSRGVVVVASCTPPKSARQDAARASPFSTPKPRCDPGQRSATAPSPAGSATGAIRASRPAAKSSSSARSTLKSRRTASCIVPLEPFARRLRDHRRADFLQRALQVGGGGCGGCHLGVLLWMSICGCLSVITLHVYS